MEKSTDENLRQLEEYIRSLREGTGNPPQLDLEDDWQDVANAISRLTTSKPDEHPSVAVQGPLDDNVTESGTLSRNLEVIANQIPGVIYQFRLDPDGAFSLSYVSRGYEKLSGISAEEAMEDFDRAVQNIHPDDRTGFFKSIENVIGTGEPWRREFRYLLPDGTIKWVMAQSEPVLHPDGTTTHSGVMVDITRRKEAQEELEKKTKRFRLAKNAARIGTWEWDLETDIVRLDQNARKLFALEGDGSFQLQELLSRIAEEDLNERSALETLDDTDGRYEIQFRVESAGSPDVTWVQARGELPDETGRSDRVFGVFIDITDEVQSERKLAESEYRLRQMAENIQDVFWMRDTDTDEILYVSPAYESIWGRNVDELYENPRQWIESIHPDDIDEVRKVVGGEHESSYEVEYRIRRPNGEVRWIKDSGYPVTDENGNVTRITGVATDITDKVILDKERQKFVELVENSGDLIFRASLDGKITYLNPTALAHLPYRDKNEVIGEPVEVLVPEDQLPTLEKLRTSLREKGHWFGEIDFRTKDGNDSLSAILNAFSINDPETGRPLEVAGVATDISEQIEIQDELLAAIEQKETLIKEVHHRVKNNLQIIVSLLRMQARQGDTAGRIKILEESRNRIQSMALIHEQLYQSENLAAVNLGKYVTNLARTLIDSYGDGTQRIQFEDAIEVDSLPLDDCISVGLIINELVANAIEHGLGGGDGAIRISFTTSGDNYNLTVADNGSGLPNDFELDAQDSLGLRLVQSLAEDQLNGSLEFSSNGETTFTVRLPKSQNG